MKKIPKRVLEPFMMFLTVIGYKAKMNPDLSMTCINVKMPKQRRQIVLWQDGQMNKNCQLLWLDFCSNWLAIGKEFIEELNKASKEK